MLYKVLRKKLYQKQMKLTQQKLLNKKSDLILINLSLIQILLTMIGVVVPTAITFWYRIENGKNCRNKSRGKKMQNISISIGRLSYRKAKGYFIQDLSLFRQKYFYCYFFGIQHLKRWKPNQVWLCLRHKFGG